MSNLRDSKIIAKFKSGKTTSELAAHYKLTRQRISKIIKDAGLNRFEGGRHVKNHILKPAAKDMYYISRWGHDSSAHETLRKLGKEMMLAGASRGQTPIGAFNSQRHKAKKRGVAWKLTLAEWWSIWETSGQFLHRGVGHNKYVMSRYNDTGPYAVGNVFIQKADENNKEFAVSMQNELKRLRAFYLHVKEAHSLPDCCCPSVDID